jgi:hypothetical protein
MPQLLSSDPLPLSTSAPLDCRRPDHNTAGLQVVACVSGAEGSARRGGPWTWPLSCMQARAHRNGEQ